jgi:hypothetical protein
MRDIMDLEEQLEKATRLLFLLYTEKETDRDLIDIENFLEYNSDDYLLHLSIEEEIENWN